MLKIIVKILNNYVAGLRQKKKEGNAAQIQRGASGANKVELGAISSALK